MRIERPDRGRLWGVLASVASIVVIGIGNYWNSGGVATAEVRAVVLADLLLVGADRRVVGWIYCGEQATGRTPWRHAGPGGDLVLVGCLLSLPLSRSGPGRDFSSFREVSSSAWLALAILGLFITPLGWAFQNLSLRQVSTRARSPRTVTARLFLPSSGGMALRRDTDACGLFSVGAAPRWEGSTGPAARGDRSSRPRAVRADQTGPRCARASRDCYSRHRGPCTGPGVGRGNERPFVNESRGTG